MKNPLFHALGVAAALIGFLFFRLWPSTPPLSVTQDDYLQRIAATQPTPAPPPVVARAPVPAAALVPPDEPGEPVEPQRPAPATVTAVAPVAPPPNAEPERTAVPAKPSALVRRPPAASPTPQGVNARFTRKDVQPGQKTGGVNDIYSTQSQALDDYAKKTGRGG